MIATRGSCLHLLLPLVLILTLLPVPVLGTGDPGAGGVRGVYQEEGGEAGDRDRVRERVRERVEREVDRVPERDRNDVGVRERDTQERDSPEREQGSRIEVSEAATEEGDADGVLEMEGPEEDAEAAHPAITNNPIRVEPRPVPNQVPEDRADDARLQEGDGDEGGAEDEGDDAELEDTGAPQGGPAVGAPAGGPAPVVTATEAAADAADVDDAGDVEGAGDAIVDPDGDPTTDGYRANQAIVRLAAGADIGAFNERHGTSTIATIPGRDIYLLQLPLEAAEPAVVERLEGDLATVWAELNFIGQAPEGRPGRFFVSGTPTTADPASSYAPSLLGLATGWACASGGGVTVAVLDTGVDPAHPLLAGRLSGAGWNVLDAGPDYGDYGNSVDDDGDGLVDEMTGHGTHVAGIVAQAAPAASILPIKALDSDGVGDAFFLAMGIFYALDSGAGVINLSLGSTYNSRVVGEATAEAVAGGIVVVAAAGNADRQEPAEFPATGGTALGVASTNEQDRKSAFSNYHPVLTISAPGSEIISAFPGGGYASWSGTSMATPWVSGAAALLLSRDSGLGPTGVADRLSEGAVPLAGANPNYAGLLGAGRLDVGGAVGCP